MRKFILLISILFTFIGAQAQATSVRLGYCNGEVAKSGQFGVSEATTVEAAIYLPEAIMDNHVGNKIETIKAGLSTKLNLTQLTVWVRAELDGENLVETTAEKIVKGWNDVALTTPYEITGEKGLYIGYTIVQKGAAFGISTVGVYEENALFVKLGSDQEWQSPTEYGVASIEAVVTGENLPKFDLKLENAVIPENYPIDTPMKVSVGVRNVATYTITGFDVECAIENSEPIVTHVDCNLEYDTLGSFEFVIHPTLQELKEDVKMTISIIKLNEGDDQYIENNSKELLFNVINKVYERNLVIEEFTTEQCPNCPGGSATLHEAMDILKEEYPNNQLNLICHHAGYYTDWLTVDASENMLWLFNQGGSTYAPAFMSDRTGVWSNPGSAEKMADKLRSRLDKPAYVGLEMDASYDVETKTLSVTVTGERSIIFCENAPRITIYLTENNIKARNQSGYGTEYIHNNALRAYNDPWGWGEEITWNEDNTFEYTCDFTIKDKWVSDNMEIIAFVSDYDADDASSCVIENSIMRPFTDFYLGSVEASLADDVRVRVEDNDIVVDGRYNELKVYSVNGFEMSHENLPAGVYIVKVSTEDNNYSIRKVVVR